MTRAKGSTVDKGLYFENFEPAKQTLLGLSASKSLPYIKDIMVITEITGFQASMDMTNITLIKTIIGTTDITAIKVIMENRGFLNIKDMTKFTGIKVTMEITDIAGAAPSRTSESLRPS
jgi:hypothetical protein